MKSLEARLVKLEATHKRILRCLWCRFILRDMPPSHAARLTTNADDFLLVKCWTCGAQFYTRLEGRSERQREVSKLLALAHPTEVYNDERVHTAQAWKRLSGSQVKRYRAFKQRLRDDARSRSRGVSPAQASYVSPSDKTADQRRADRERESLQKQAIDFKKKENERWKRLAKGPETFPITETLKEIEARYKLENYGDGMKEYVAAAGLPVDEHTHWKALSAFKTSAVICHQFLSVLKRREACELVLWSKTEPNTLKEIDFFESRLKYLPNITRRAIAKEKEKERLEAEQRQREWEERERQRQARMTPRQEVVAKVEEDRHAQFIETVERVVPEPLPEFDERGRKRVTIPVVPVEISGPASKYCPGCSSTEHSHPPSDDGSYAYRQKLAHYRQTGMWIPDHWMR
jgi:hypothetical protein